MPARLPIRWRAIPDRSRKALAVGALVLAGCAEAASQHAAAMREDDARQVLVTIDDVSARVAPALADPQASVQLQQDIGVLRQAFEARDAAGARRALTNIRASFAAYEQRAPTTDAADRDAIRFALDVTADALAR